MEEYQRTKLGKWLYAITMSLGSRLVRHPILAQILSVTWGLPGILIGLIEMLVVLMLPKKKSFGKFNGFPYIMFGNNWGGLSGMMWFFVADNMGEEWTEHTKQHECGHCYQNAIFGPLMPFLVLIPSAIRYWMKTGKPYDSVWYEGSSTDLGGYHTAYWNQKKAAKEE